MRRLLAGCLALLAVTLPGPARAFAVCDRLAAVDEPQFVDNLALFLFKASPLRDIETARDLRIEFVTEPDWFGPFADKIDGRNYIGIPRGFPVLLCNLVMVGSLIDRPSALTDPIDECMRRGRDGLPRCIDLAVQRHRPAAERKFATLSDVDRLNQEDVVGTALGFLMVHELAHVTLGHVGRAVAPEERAGLEFDADLYAARYSILAKGGPAGAATVFDILAGVKEMEARGPSSHDSYFCRRENILNITAISDFIPGALNIFPGSRDFVHRADRDTIVANRLATLRRIASGQAQNQVPMRFSAQCRVKGLPQLEAVRRDLLRLARFQHGVADALPASNDGEGVAAILKRLVALPMESADGRAVRMNLIATYVDSYRSTRSDDTMTVFILNTTRLPDIDDARAFDVAALYQDFGLRLLYYPAGGKQTQDGYDAIESALLLGIQLGNYDSETLFALVRFGVETKNCSWVEDAVRLAEALDDEAFSPAMVKQLRKDGAAGGCPVH